MRWLTCLLALAACGGDSSSPGGGSLTVRDACTQIASTFCAKLGACGVPVPAGCADSFASSCCSGAACDAASGVDSAGLDRCLSDFQAETCPQATSGTLPASCPTHGSLPPDAGVPQQPDAPPASPDAGTSGGTRIVTELGMPYGSPVSKSFDSGGGSLVEPTTGATVVVRPGTFTGSATVSARPTTDTLPPGLGDGVLIQNDQPLALPLRVTLPYGAEVADPTTLGLAAQDVDGSWYALRPVKVDTQAHTITALVPDSLTAPVPGKKRPRAIPAAAPSGRIVVKWTGSFYLVPKKKTLLVNQKLTLTPYAVGELPPFGVDCSVDTDCVAIAEMASVVFTNNKVGYIRAWTVNDTQGDDVVGTIMPTGDVGAQYTAPAKQPNPSTVTVKFSSINLSDPSQKASPTSSIKVVGGDYSGTLKGSFEAAYSYTANASFTQVVANNDIISYAISGMVTVTNPVAIGPYSCTLSPASGPILPSQDADDLVIYLTAADKIPANSYSIQWGYHWTGTYDCGDGVTLPADITGAFQTDFCSGVGAVYMTITSYDELKDAITCGMDSFSWDLTR